MKIATQALSVQNGIYAAEKFSDSFCISHVVNLLVESEDQCIHTSHSISLGDTFTDDTMWISWTDREGAIFSSGFSFSGNPSLMLVLLLVLQRFGRRQWGYISELTTENGSVSLHPIDADGTLGGNEVDVNFYPEDRVHSSWALLGRATTVVGANRTEEGDGRTTKDKHIGAHDEVKGGVARVDSRTDSEDTQQTRGATDPDRAVDEVDDGGWRAFYRARDSYRKAHRKTINIHNLVLKVSWPETSRVEEWKVIRRSQALGKDDKFIKGHIPEVKYARDLARYSTQHVRDFLGLEPDGRPGTQTLRLIVMSRLRPIYDLDGEQFWKAFWECFACMHLIVFSNSCSRRP